MPTEAHSSNKGVLRLYRRKGGGGRGGGAKGKGSSSSSGKGSSAKTHGASTSFINSPGGSSFSLSSSSKTSASPYSDGGGKSYTLGSDSKFSGRLAGGGSRANIYGTSSFGSGYPYGGTTVYVDYRPLPYTFYPVPCAHNYYGGDEYLDDRTRPGGALVTAIVRAPVNTTTEVYRIAGDKASVVSVFNALVANCSISNTSQYDSYNPSTSVWPLPEQVVQYYRASSFVLSLDNYNNTAALASNAPSSNTSAPNGIAATPLPSTINGTFLTCLNTTIAASVPLVDPSHKKFSTGAIVGMAIGGALGAILISGILWICCLRKTYQKCLKKLKGIKGKGKGKVFEDVEDTPGIQVVEPSDMPPAYHKILADKGEDLSYLGYGKKNWSPTSSEWEKRSIGHKSTPSSEYLFQNNNLGYEPDKHNHNGSGCSTPDISRPPSPYSPSKPYDSDYRW